MAPFYGMCVPGFKLTYVFVSCVPCGQ